MEGLMTTEKLKHLSERSKKALIDMKQGAQETINKIRGNIRKGDQKKEH